MFVSAYVLVLCVLLHMCVTFCNVLRHTPFLPFSSFLLHALCQLLVYLPLLKLFFRNTGLNMCLAQSLKFTLITYKQNGQMG